MRTTTKMILCILLLVGCSYQEAPRNPHRPCQASGIKIGEVTHSDAIIWTRLTSSSLRLGSRAPMPEVLYRNPITRQLEKRGKGRPDLEPEVTFPRGSTVDTLEGSVPGTTGRVRIVYKPQDSEKWQKTDYHFVDPLVDYTRQFRLTDLSPGTQYLVRVETVGNDGHRGQTLEGSFKTAPLPDKSQPIVFTVTTGQAYGDQDLTGQGFKIYPQMLKLDPDFFVHTGDILYYDKLAKTLPLARWHWWRTYSLPTNVDFHRQVSSYFIKDDHDTWMNDCWPERETRFMGDFTFEQGQAVFLEQVPMGDRTWRTFRWGKDLQIWLAEGRDYRSPNTMDDGPDKTIWGKEQKQWFKRTVQQSDATFRVLISPTPLVGPDRTNKNDNHSNKGFTHEGDELRQFISQQKNMYVVCGDRHWQYVSQDSITGVGEYSCGPATNAHAGGWKNEYKYAEHKYLNVTGGFLAGFVENKNGKPALTFRHYSVEGEVLNADCLLAE